MTDEQQAPADGATPKHIAGVRFQSVGKVYHFDASGYADLRVGDHVIVETTRGRQMGQVASIEPLTDKRAAQETLKPIERVASGRDLAVRRYWEGKELEALSICREANQNIKLPIKIVRAEYSFDGARLTFWYSSDSEEKVETRDLKQEISRSFRARVDMKLVGPRDVAKLLGGFGACGEVRCCSRFLTEFSPVSIKMAKEQGISLNPQEITGMCGRLRCCLVYEYEQYVLARKALPARNKEIGTPQGKGTVVDILPLKDSVVVQIGEQQTIVHRDEIVPLEEWEALQKRAAEPCPGGPECTGGSHKPKVQAQPEEATTSASPASPAAEKSQHAAPRRHRREHRHARSANPPASQATDDKPTSPRKQRPR